MSNQPDWLKAKHDEGDYQPVILDPSNLSDAKKLEELSQSKPVIIDDLAEQVAELKQLDPQTASAAQWDDGRWVYYPWRHRLVHVLAANDFKRLRTSRNLNLITTGEQSVIDNLTVGVAGLNVGNPAAVCLALEGSLNTAVLADNDVLSLSNLNRFRAGLPDLGVNKAVLSARQIYEVNPYAELTVMPEGLKPGGEDDFLLRPKLDVLIEEMDHVGLKISLRERARQHGIPVVMVTGNGEDVILDVERFDEQSELPLLNGHLKDEVISRINAGPPPDVPGKAMLARDFMGAQHLRPRLLESFEEVGHSLVSIPQLAETSFMRGAVVAYAVRQIATGQMPSGRYHIRLSELNND